MTAVLLFGALLLVACVFVGAALWQLSGYFQARLSRSEPRPLPLAAQRPLPPEPRLQGAPGHEQSPSMDLWRLRRQEEEMLQSYGWVEPQAGVVRIPLARARQLLLERDLPARREAGGGEAPSAGRSRAAQ